MAGWLVVVLSLVSKYTEVLGYEVAGVRTIP
jgi:hypothetical protein